MDSRIFVPSAACSVCQKCEVKWGSLSEIIDVHRQVVMFVNVSQKQINCFVNYVHKSQPWAPSVLIEKACIQKLV